MRDISNKFETHKLKIKYGNKFFIPTWHLVNTCYGSRSNILLCLVSFNLINNNKFMKYYYQALI